MINHSKYPKEAGIYKLTCIENGKIYIGKSINIRNRMGDHRKCCNKTEGRYYFEHALIKYGWDAFTVEILEIFENFDKLKDNTALLDKESYYIGLFDSDNRDKGYNSCKHSTDRTGHKCSEETKEKIRQANLGNTRCLGKKHSEETKEKMSLAHMGSIHSEKSKDKIRQGNLGKKMSEESKEKIRKANSGKILSEETKERCKKSNLGRIISKEHREKLKQAHLGKTLSEEHKEKLRQARLNNIQLDIPKSHNK